MMICSISTEKQELILINKFHCTLEVNISDKNHKQLSCTQLLTLNGFKFFNPANEPAVQCHEIGFLNSGELIVITIDSQE